jgi:hypothetical protein
VDGVALVEKELRQIGAILSGGACKDLLPEAATSREKSC